MAMKDEELIKGCKEGKAIAQRELFERYCARMMAVCLRYMGNKDAAQDVLQEGFIKVFQNINLFREEGSFEGWLRKIMVNTALKQLRKQRSIRLDDYPEAFELHPDFDEVLDKLAVEDLLQMVAGLPDGYRIVFNLSVLEGFSHQVIATELGISESTSRSQLYKARKQLQKLIIASQEIKMNILPTGK